MRIITHNMLKCNVRGVENGYPLIIEAEKTEVVECDFNKELVEKILKKIQIAALRSAALNLKLEGKWLEVADLPLDTLLADEDMLRELHNLVFEIHVLEGNLICPESGRKFPIKDGIPNMLLHEDEV